MGIPLKVVVKVVRLVAEEKTTRFGQRGTTHRSGNGGRRGRFVDVEGKVSRYVNRIKVDVENMLGSQTEPYTPSTYFIQFRCGIFISYFHGPASMLVPAKKGDARSILILRRAICAFKIIYYTYGNNWSRFTENIITEFSKFQQRRVLYLKEYSRTRRNSMPKTITFWKTWRDNYPLQKYPDAFSRFSIPIKNSFESS